VQEVSDVVREWSIIWKRLYVVSQKREGRRWEMSSVVGGRLWTELARWLWI